ncbi:MAG: two-component system VirA-like sensor kinase [Xanthobacteraceae bacterium]|nr:two-component system VirA-like sensor kinase [Xanthobacteraceae bacterium]
MRVKLAVLFIPLLLLFLFTWLSLRGMNPEAEEFDRALSTLNGFVVSESALQRDVLAARAGLLRNYDSIVRETNELSEALDQLRELTRADPPIGSAIRPLGDSLDQQEHLTEQFKTDNALLQNSLSYFELFSNRLTAADRTGPLAPRVTMLSAAMLRLALDTSPVTASEVEQQLDALAAERPSDSDSAATQALLAHGRLLRKLLPQTDATLKALFALPIKQEQRALRAVVLDHQLASRNAARRFRVLLYAGSVVLVGILIGFALQLRERARALRHRAALEHVITGISTRFINAKPHEILTHVETALAELGEFFAADRVYILLIDPPSRAIKWHRDGTTYPADWLQRANAALSAFSGAMRGIVYVSDVNHLPASPLRDALLNCRIRSWMCTSNFLDENRVDAGAIVGFDLIQAQSFTRVSARTLLPMALHAIASAIERQRLEQDRTRLEQRLQQARRMETVGALTSGIAHNFNNIVGAILGHAEMAEALVGSKKPLNNITAIRRAAERARDLVDQLLTYGRRREARRQPVNIGLLMTEAETLLRPALPDTIELVINDAAKTAIISGEPAQLQQVIINLCNNAAQATSGHGRIEVSAELREVARQALSHGEFAEGRYVVITVSDNGRGMDEITLGKIFEPFFTTRAAGNGLGLATVREIVREHGGALNVRTQPGAGSAFEAWLPCTVAPEAAKPTAAPALPLGNGQTILLLDDDRERLLKNEEILAALGYEPVGFSRPEEALAACREAQHRFDVAVLTVRGAAKLVAVANALRRVTAELPIVLAVPTSDHTNADALAEARITEVVRNPLAAIELAAALARCRDAVSHRLHQTIE